jgi:hypothetical protein
MADEREPTPQLHQPDENELNNIVLSYLGNRHYRHFEYAIRNGLQRANDVFVDDGTTPPYVSNDYEDFDPDELIKHYEDLRQYIDESPVDCKVSFFASLLATSLIAV